MFERRNKDENVDADAAPASRVDSLLTTDDILARVHRRSRMPLSRILLWLSLALGLILLVVGSTVIILGDEQARPKQAATSEAPLEGASKGQTSSDAPSGAHAMHSTTPVSINLSHVGSVYVDGRYVGLQRHVQVRLTPGEHALLVRFGHHAYTQALHVGTLSSCVRCDKRKGCGPLKAHASL